MRCLLQQLITAGEIARLDGRAGVGQERRHHRIVCTLHRCELALQFRDLLSALVDRRQHLVQIDTSVDDQIDADPCGHSRQRAERRKTEPEISASRANFGRSVIRCRGRILGGQSDARRTDPERCILPRQRACDSGYSELRMTNNQMPVAAPLSSDSAGKGGPIAMPSVFRIICPSTGSMGTGFAHQSGGVITAEHVIRGAQPQDIVIRSSSNAHYRVQKVHSDATLDLAVLQPTAMPQVQALLLSAKTDFQIGTQVSTWGYPMGYMGAGPMLTVGYLSGDEQVNGAAQWVINAAFNSGNSGGPVLHLEDASVLGVVSSKLAPLPDHINSILQALSQQMSGFMYPSWPQSRHARAPILAPQSKPMADRMEL